jgi:GNAT superfamily N-acetyltransferase
VIALAQERFGVRPARAGDARAIAAVLVASWRDSYHGILPDAVLGRLDVGERTRSRQEILRSGDGLQLVAVDTTFGEVVGFCDAGPSRRPGPWQGEVYAIYLARHAKRYGLGTRMFEDVMAWLHGTGARSMVVWVLEHNGHARRFYEALGGVAGPKVRSSVDGFGVIEVGYVWEELR